MVLGIAEDFSSNATLDAELTAIPESGLYVNSGVHPKITVENLLSFLPVRDITYANWDYTKDYGVYENLRSKDALMQYSYLGVTKVYQSLKTPNVNKNPIMHPDYWLETNIESLRIKSFLAQVKDKVVSDLNLTKRLINNQFLYQIAEVNRSERPLPSNYCGYVIEPKGSDYMRFRINQISFQKSGTSPVNLYVLNQGVLVDTLTITPKDGKVEFDDLGYEFYGKGKWQFVIDSTTVFSDSAYIDTLKFDGMTFYSCVGTGLTPETATWSWGNTGMGIGLNISSFLDSSLYVENNLADFGGYIRAAFEYMAFEMFLHNVNSRSNMQQRLQMNEEMLKQEVKDLINESSVRRYKTQLKQAKSQLDKSYDTQLMNDKDKLTITLASN